MQTLSVADKAYLAGLIDGEGCITILRQLRGGRYDYSLALIVQMGEPDILQYCQTTTGLGTLHHNSIKGRGTWRWQLRKRAAAELLGQVRPYLRVKAEQADRALEFAAGPVEQSFRKAIYETLRALKLPPLRIVDTAG